MLKSFSVSNYRVFKEQITLDFSRVRDYKFNECCIHNGLISKSIMYGKNAKGKSNLGYALMDIRSMLTSRAAILGDSLGYLNAMSKEEVASFTYHFVINNHQICYHYKKLSVNEIQYEELSIDNNKMYHYDFQNKVGDFTRLLQYKELRHLNFDEWDNETPVFRYILTNAKLQELTIMKDLSSFVAGMALLEPRTEGLTFSGPRLTSKGIISMIIEEDLIDDFTEFLNQAGIMTKLKKDIKPDGDIALYFDYPKPIDFVKNMSSGTRVLTALYLVLRKLNDITFLYIDEFDANLHFELSENILNLLKQQKGCQILFTTHNTDLMSNKIMRPDCYFIITSQGIVSVADATARELREGHNLEKLYQSGEFSGMVSE